MRANFLPLTKIALALLDRRTLDLAEIEEIIAANAPDDDVSDGGDDGDDEASYVNVPDTGAVLLRSIMPTAVRTLYGAAEPIPRWRSDLVFYA